MSVYTPVLHSLSSLGSQSETEFREKLLEEKVTHSRAVQDKPDQMEDPKREMNIAENYSFPKLIFNEGFGWLGVCVEYLCMCIQNKYLL